MFVVIWFSKINGQSGKVVPELVETSGYSGTGIVRRSSSVALDTLLISFEPLEQQGHSGNHTCWSSEFSSENYYRDQRILRHRNCPTDG
jgi:hypothetical protein